MLKIGFTNKYYTLWDVCHDVTHLDNGVVIEKTHCAYIKNISFDRDVAMSKYPGVEVDEDLRGHERSFSYTKEIYPDDVFRFGRYRGNKFSDCHDYSYMSWYFTQTHVTAQEILKPILENNGYYIYKRNLDDSYDIMTIEEHNAMLRRDAERDELRKRILETMEFPINWNPDEKGYCYDVDSEMSIKFDEVKEYWYDGCPYYLPVLKGKAKRVKRKTIKITDYDVDGDVINVHSFEVLKK